MKICKGWSKNAHRYLGRAVAQGEPNRSRAVEDYGEVRYRAEVMREDGSSLVVELTSRELLALVLTAPAVAAMQALDDQDVSFDQWLQVTKSILESPVGGRPCQQ
jgi:hypothetical protein